MLHTLGKRFVLVLLFTITSSSTAIKLIDCCPWFGGITHC